VVHISGTAVDSLPRLRWAADITPPWRTIGLESHNAPSSLLALVKVFGVRCAAVCRYPTMPKGPEAHNAAHCEPTPGDWPDDLAPTMKPDDATSADEPLDAIHAMGVSHTSESGPVGGTSADAARDDSSAAAHGAGMSEQGEGLSQHDVHSASRPASDPQQVKDVVRHETLAEHPEGEVA
jgi:hypothetical protein